MQDYAWWWVISGILGVAEIMTGTFYLLVLAIAALAASFLAQLGLGLSAQLMGASVVSLLGWVWLRHRKRSGRQDLQALDIGEIVDVSQWDNGLGTTIYRGAHWTVELEHGVGEGAALPGKFRIRAMRGNRLIVDRAKI